jgi:hypothetical protein
MIIETATPTVAPIIVHKDQRLFESDDDWGFAEVPSHKRRPCFTGKSDFVISSSVPPLPKKTLSPFMKQPFDGKSGLVWKEPSITLSFFIIVNFSSH